MQAVCVPMDGELRRDATRGLLVGSRRQPGHPQLLQEPADQDGQGLVLPVHRYQGAARWARRNLPMQIAQQMYGELHCLVNQIVL